MEKLLRSCACIVVILLLSNAIANASSDAAKDHEQASQLSAINGHVNQLAEQSAAMQGALVEQSRAVTAIQLDQSRVMQQLLAEQKQLETVQRQLAAKADEDRGAAIRNNVATALNIIGMIFGVLGGVLLAGSQLSARQERIADMRVTRDYSDLALHEPGKQKILDFFGLLGGIFVAIGFIFQFFGALVSAPLPWFVVAALGLIAIVFVVRVFLYFLAYTPNQTPAEKAGVVIHNLRQHIFQPISRSVLRRRGVTCQVCLKRLTFLDAKVWWLDQGNTPEYPYTFPPYAFHYGHEACLPKVQDFGVYFDGTDRLGELRLDKASAKDFLEQEIPKLRAWCAGYRRYWEGRGKSLSEETPCEEQLRHVEKDILPLMP